LRSAESGFEIGENRFSGIVYEVEDSSIKLKTRKEKEPELSLSSASLSRNWEKPVLRSVKTGFEIGQNRFSGRKKPVFKLAKTGFKIG